MSVSAQTTAKMMSGGVSGKTWSWTERLSVAWVALALLLLYPASSLLHGAFPVFTLLWLVVPLVVVLRSKDAHQVGIRPIRWSEYAQVSAINLGILLLIALAVEPWSHTYQALISGATSAGQPDTTFAWLVRYDGLLAWGGMLLFSGLVTIFAEELFFRGWLLQLLQRHMGRTWAVVLQALLFTVPQGIAAFLLLPVQGVLYAVVYSWLGIGVVGGWAAARTQSIWPSLTAAVLFNFILTLLLW